MHFLQSQYAIPGFMFDYHCNTPGNSPQWAGYIHSIYTHTTRGIGLHLITVIKIRLRKGRSCQILYTLDSRFERISIHKKPLPHKAAFD